MKNKIEKEVLKEFKDEWLKKECMKDLKKIIKLTQKLKAQEVFDDFDKIEVNAIKIGCFGINIKDFRKLKKKHGVKWNVRKKL